MRHNVLATAEWGKKANNMTFGQGDARHFGPMCLIFLN